MGITSPYNGNDGTIRRKSQPHGNRQDGYILGRICIINTTFSIICLVLSKIQPIFATRNSEDIMGKTEYIGILQGCSSTLRNDYGIKSLRIFGSVARGEDHEGSDVDVFVETEAPNPFVLMDAKDFLEKMVGRSVDIIRNHKNLNPRLRNRIERDGVTVF